MRTEHLVPLSCQALALLKEIKAISGAYELIFPGDRRPTKPMSENTVNNALRLWDMTPLLNCAGMVSAQWPVALWLNPGSGRGMLSGLC
jgi:hypothetical protein